MSPEEIAALGALLTGLGGVITAIFGIRLQKKKEVDECEQRIKEVKEAFYEGIHFKDTELPS